MVLKRSSNMAVILDDIFKRIFAKNDICIWMQIAIQFVPKGSFSPIQHYSCSVLSRRQLLQSLIT